MKITYLLLTEFLVPNLQYEFFPLGFMAQARSWEMVIKDGIN